jgi:hypothetical protein
MPAVTDCTLWANDSGGGADFRSFHFQSVQQGNNFTVTITNDGIGPTVCPLSEASPRFQIPDHPGARVKPLGELSLLWDNDSDVYLVSFSGTLNSTYPTKCDKVVVASFD